jgi:hypothetical protein
MPRQSASATLYTHAETAINASTIGAAYTLPTAGASPSVIAQVHIWIAPVSTTTPAAGLVVYVQGNHDASGSDDKWVDLTNVQTGTTAASTDTTTAGITANSSSTVAMTGAATFGARSVMVFIKDSTTAGEWVRIRNHASNTINLATNQLFQVSHSSGVSVYNQAVRVPVLVDVSGLKRIRIMVDNNAQATGPTYAVFATIECMQA